MKTKMRFLALVMGVLLCFSLSTAALADNSSESFNPSVTFDRTNEENGTFTVIIPEANNAILASKAPTLSVACSYANAKVTGPDGEITATIADGKISFPVTKGGTYTIKKAFAVTFGSSVPAQIVVYGETASTPTAPSKTGYTFGGWYTDEACTTAYDFATPVTADITLHAKWVVDPRTVTFDSKGGSTVAPVTVDYGTAVSAPTSPTRNGYTFDGWYIDSECKTAYDFTTPVTANITLYAKWTYIPVYVPDTGSSNTSSSTVTNSDGSTTTTVTDKATGTVTETTKTPDGVSGTTKIDTTGNVTEVSADVPAKAVESGEIVTLPVEVPVASNSTEAVVVEISVPDTGAKVEVPVPNATAGTVAIIVHADGTEEIVQTSVITENGVALLLEEDAQLKIVDNSKDFTDVDGEWFQTAADFVSARGIITGNTADTFSPDTDSSRTMIWTMLARLDGEDTSVGEAWWSVGKQWAVDNGISDGSLSDQSITREQLITMLYRYAQLKGMDVSVGEDTNILSYNDAFEVSEWAIPAMQWACGSGVVQGDGVNLMPSATASRAEVAQILMNFCNYLVL